MATLDDFKKIELKVGKILSAERVEGSEKLLKLRVALGAEERQVIAGIGKAYSPESLLNKNIVIVVNLEPRMLMGLESQGMLLAAEGADGPIILMPEHDAPAGARIR